LARLLQRIVGGQASTSHQQTQPSLLQEQLKKKEQVQRAKAKQRAAKGDDDRAEDGDVSEQAQTGEQQRQWRLFVRSAATLWSHFFAERLLFLGE
jgi:hypothetical protein